MIDTVHIRQRVVHNYHGAGTVETWLYDAPRMGCGGKMLDVIVRFDSNGAMLPVCADDLRDEADDDRR